jgi:hypothetical protein
MTHTAQTAAPIAALRDLDRELAVRSYNALSHVPEHRADTDIRFYVEAVAALHKKLSELAKTPEQRALIPAQIERYKASYRKHQHAIWAAQTRAASAFILGPANFPTARNNKRLDTVDRRRAELLEWKANAEKAGARAILDARTGERLIADEWRYLGRHLAHDVGIIQGIDAGTLPYYTRCTFVTSIAGRIERLANSGERELVSNALQFIRAQQADMGKPIFSESHSVWTLESTAQQTTASRKTG